MQQVRGLSGQQEKPIIAKELDSTAIELKEKPVEKVSLMAQDSLVVVADAPKLQPAPTDQPLSAKRPSDPEQKKTT